MNMPSEQSIHLCKSVIQTSYDIVKAHGGELKVETNHGEDLPGEQSDASLLYNYPLSESLIKRMK